MCGLSDDNNFSTPVVVMCRPMYRISIKVGFLDRFDVNLHLLHNNVRLAFASVLKTD